MKVVEKFVSINGEGPLAGELAVFIRFWGCNLACSYCDTKWANEKDCPYEERTAEELVSYAKETGVRNVTLTGGEPLLAHGMAEFILLLRKEGFGVEIETNGSVDLTPYLTENRPVFTMDYKLPSSGWEQAMRVENFSLMKKEDTVKFVVGSKEDLVRAGEVIEKFELTKRCHVYLSPVFGQMEPAEIVDYMIEKKWNDVRIQIQMHKVIWDPEKRGV